MSTTEAEEQLKDYLLKGVGTQIALAEQAFALAEEIGQHAEQINAANFGELFGVLQETFSDRQTLEATKLFDEEGKYKTRSIPGTLNLLKRHATLWRIPRREKLTDALIQGGEDASYLGQLSNEELTHAVVKHYRATLPNVDTVRKIRNKVIAHNEDINREALPSLTWGEPLYLVDYAKNFIATIGYGYLNVSFDSYSSEYSPTVAAKRPARALHRLLRAAGIVEGHYASDHQRPSPAGADEA